MVRPFPSAIAHARLVLPLSSPFGDAVAVDEVAQRWRVALVVQTMASRASGPFDGIAD